MHRLAALLACAATLTVASASGRADTAPPTAAPAPGAAPPAAAPAISAPGDDETPPPPPGPVITLFRADRRLGGYAGATGTIRRDVMLEATIGLEMGLRLGTTRFYGRGALETGVAGDDGYGGKVTEGRVGIEYRICGEVINACAFAGTDAGISRFTGAVDDHAYVPYDFGDDGDTTGLVLEPRAGVEVLGSVVSVRLDITERIFRITESDETWYGGGFGGTLALRW